MKALRLRAEWRPRPDHVLSERERETRRAFVSSQVYHSPALQIEDVPVPVPGPDEVLIQVRACGLCGSDVHLYETLPDGYVAYGDHTRLPVVLGHEFSGVIAAVGSNVRTLRPGEGVCAEPMNWCGECAACRSGWVNQCVNLEETGYTVDGALAEYVVTKAKYCWSVDGLREALGDDERAFEAAAMVEPCAVTFNAMFIRAGGFLPGSCVAIFGAGPIGLTAIAQARAAGAATIIAFETLADRRDLARRLGADRVVDPIALAQDGQDGADHIRDLTRGEGIAMGVEAAGATTRTYPVLERAMAVGGKIVQVGIGVGQTPLTLIRLQQGGTSVVGSMGNSGSGIFPSVIRLMAARRIDLGPMVTARFPLTEAREAIARTAERRDGKVLVRMT